VTVGGPQVAIGLLQDDGTIAPIRGRRFRSGDLAIRDEDGFVRITGRAKDIIKRGGIMISPTEVDAVLMAHPALLDAASLGVPDAIYGEEVVAFGVRRPDVMYDEAAVLKDCAEKLPVPKRPKGIFFISELPRSDRGKILREKLREEWSRRISPP
jgi:long-chain acyl-CoA synthetase